MLILKLTEYQVMMRHLRYFLLSHCCGFSNNSCRYQLQSSVCLKRCVIYPYSMHHVSRRLAHTVRGWKAMVNPKPEVEGEETPSASCEDGTDAVPHSVILSDLNRCKTVEEQIYTLHSRMTLTPEDVENRQAFCRTLSEAIRPYFASSKVHLFGSSMNGLGFRGCDVDACVQTLFEHSETVTGYAKYGDVPVLDDVLAGKVPPDIVANLHPKLRLRFVRRILRRHCKGIREPILLIRARTPILRFYHEDYNVFCDLSCENRFALQNTKLMRFLTHLDERFGPLAKTLRYWGKYGKFVGDIDRFNSHSYSLLIVYFLQNTNPPLIPKLSELVDKADYLTKGDVCDDELLFRSLKNVKQTKNKQSVADLLREFFYFYFYYDFDRVMLPLSASSVPKFEFQPGEDSPTEVFEMSSISVQDPFRLSFNSTWGVTFKYCKRFLSSVSEACLMYQQPNLWVPREGNWGLSLLLESVYKEGPITGQRTSSFDIILQPKVCSSQAVSDPEGASLTRMAETVQNILEYGLLFRCKLSNFTEDSSEDKQNIIRLQCEVVHNVWIGRNHVREKHLSNTHENPLELEHLVSCDLVQQNTSRQGVFKFFCEMYGIRESGDMHLRVSFKCQVAKFPLPLSVFLADYLPKTLNRLL